MKRYYRLFIIPAVIVIILGILSGFRDPSTDKIVGDLLKERTNVLQRAYYKTLEMEKAEESLQRIETYPLLSEDIYYLRAAEATEMDVIKHMEIVEQIQNKKMFDYISYDVVIRWYMNGLNGDYVTEHPYSVVIKSTKEGYKISEFNGK